MTAVDFSTAAFLVVMALYAICYYLWHMMHACCCVCSQVDCKSHVFITRA